MRKRMKLVCSALAAGLALPAMLHAQAPSPGDIGRATDLLRKQQRWQTECMPKGCIISVDILRGDYGSPPDPNDVNQYVSVSLAVDRSPQKVNFLMFEVDPHANKDAGIVISLAKTIRDGSGWKIQLDPEGTFQIPIDRCDNTTCKAILRSGLTKDGKDLVAKMQQDTHLFLLYTHADDTYRTAVNLDLFREAYQQMLAVKLRDPPAIQP